MKYFYKPAIALMKQLKYPQKFTLISVLFALPLGLVLFLFISEIDRAAAFSQKELYGTQYLRPLRQLYQHAEQGRLYMQDYAYGITTSNADLTSNEVDTDNDLEALKVVDERYGASLKTTGKVNALEKSWEEIKATDISSQQRQGLQARFVTEVQAFIAYIGDTSNLILDPDLDSYYTMDALLLKLVDRVDKLVETEISANSVVARRDLGSDEKAELLVSSALISDNVQKTQQGMEIAFKNNPMGNLKPNLEGPLKDDKVATEAFVATLNREVLSAPLIVAAPTVIRTYSRDAQAASFRLWDAEVGQLDRLLSARIDSYVQRKNLAISVTAVMLVLVVYLWGGFYIVVMRTVSSLKEASSRMVSGKASGHVDLDNKDELGQIAVAFNSMATAADQLSSTVNERTSELTQVAFVLAYMHNGIMITDNQGRIETLNNAACKMLGVNYDDAIGRELTDVVRDAAMHEVLSNALATPAKRHQADLAVGGHSVMASVTAMPGTNGNRAMMVVVLEDVTELRRLQRLRFAGYAGVNN